jgi:hypothetical protein
MKSFIAVVVAVVVVGAMAVPALAMPVDKGARPASSVKHVAPVPPSGQGGTDTVAFVLIGVGAALAFGAGGYMGARSIGARQVRPRTS